MEQYHASSVSTEHLHSLMQSFRRPFLEEGSPCKVCKVIPKDTRKHLARHQIQLALFALLRRYLGDDVSEDDGSANPRQGMASRRSLGTSVDLNFGLDTEADSDEQNIYNSQKDHLSDSENDSDFSRGVRGTFL